MATAANPRISIISVVHAHECHVEHFHALMHQDLDRSQFEIIYVDGRNPPPQHGSPLERAVEEAAGAVSARHARIGKTGRAACSNFGIGEARADLVLLLADDFIANPKLVRTHLELHQANPEAHLVGLGPAIFPEKYRHDPLMSWLEQTGRLFGVPLAGISSISKRFFYGVNVSAKKEFLLRAGLFDEEFPYHAWDDYEFGLRLFRQGMEVRFLTDAAAIHEHQVTLDDRRHSMHEAGESALIFEAKYPGRHPWHRLTKYPHQLLALAAWLVKGQALLFPAEKRWQRYYLYTLTHHFVMAYQRAKRAKHRRTADRAA